MLSVERLQSQLQRLLEQEKYSQALDKLNQIRQRFPETTITPSEGSIWLLRGQQEYAQARYAQAETSCRRSLELGLEGEAHYWLAKSLLALDQVDAALALMRAAFETKKLPKDYAGCYLKLLLLQEETESVADLIAHQSKRFYAPQLHWARGMLALKAGNSSKALTHLKKMGRSATPGDTPTAWTAYVHQQADNWKQAEQELGLSRFGSWSRFPFSHPFPKHPALQRLSIQQAVATRQPLHDMVGTDATKLPQHQAALVLELLHLIDVHNIHEAAHIFQELDYPSDAFPELEQLRRPVMLLAGEQALQEQQPECTEEFWGSVIKQPPFDPYLAFQLHRVCKENDSYRQSQRLLTQVIDWLKQEAKRNPQDWPTSRLNLTLANLHCQSADVWMLTKQQRQSARALKVAERLCPDSPEVIGRRGLMAHVKGDLEQAVPLLTQALEQGCQYEAVYGILLNCLEEQGDQKNRQEIRRRFGKHFGDLNAETKVKIPVWVDALSTQDYRLFEQLVLEQSNPEPALRVCQIFVQAAADEPSASNRITLEQSQATKAWDQLLQRLSAPEQIPVLQAIFLVIQRFAKRKKGIAALQTRYQQQLFALVGQYPEAQLAHLVLVVVKGLKSERLQAPLRDYLDTASQPGIALAQLQLQARRFTSTTGLGTYLDEALSREPQNPQLLLAKATTFAAESRDYNQYKDQGFELARRLQDAAALQAFREEESFQTSMVSKALIPDLFNKGGARGLDLAEMVRKMARKMFGEDIPPDVLAQLLPELQKQLDAELSGINFKDVFFDDDDFFEEDNFFESEGREFFELDPLNAGLPFGWRPKKRAKRKRGF